MPETWPRRRLLAASTATLPWLLAVAGCRSSDAFAGPDPLAGRPPLSPDVITLQAVIAAEENLINLYKAAISGGSRTKMLESLLSQHQAHLVRLKGQLVEPTATASPGPAASTAAGRVTGRVTTGRLRAAEHASATDLVRRLATVPPALAQLFASIAASDATHVTVLDG